MSDIVQRASARYGVPAAIIQSVIMNESGGDPKATSPKGAMGLMQLMPGTAAGLGVRDAYNPEQNVMGAVKHLADLYRQAGSWEHALAGYNGDGPAAWSVSTRDPRYRAWQAPYNGGYAETRKYVPKVLDLAKKYGFGVPIPPLAAPGPTATGKGDGISAGGSWGLPVGKPGQSGDKADLIKQFGLVAPEDDQ